MNKNFDIQKLKQIELEMVKQFISICDELNLQYFAIGGTLLGAVRHKGFIPWDDDIDIGILRKDYDIFLQNAQKLLPKPYFLQTHNTDTEYPLNFAKIRNSNTTFIESSVANRNMNHGVYIDIFPLDYYPDDIFSQIKFDFFWKILHFRMRSEFIIPEEYKASFPKKILQNLLMWISKLIYPSAEKAILAEEKLMKSVKLSTKIANLCGVLGKGEVVSVEYFNSTKKLMFENLNICVPNEYTKYLKCIYGNYMKLPPKEKQITHHYANIIDLDKSYTFYTTGERK